MEHKKEEPDHIFEKAVLAHRQGRFDEAEKGYLDVLKRKPDWGQARNALGEVLLDQSRTQEAKQAFEKAAHLEPPHLPACYNLARLKQQENDHAGAIDLYRTILETQRNQGEVWNNLGVAYRETGDPDQAISCFRRAVAFAPHMAEAWNNLGVAQDESGLRENAITSYTKAIEIQPAYASAHFNLGVSLQKAGRLEEAGQHYDKVLEIDPDNAPARFMHQSIGASDTPDAAPAEHVRGIFDQCAETFEKTLVEELAYKTPQLLFDILRPHLTQDMNVLDLGCGTGLGAQRYRPFAKRLTGVDVSPKMLAKAAEKEVYDRLAVFDILEAWDFPQPFDLIYSADVFVYFGNLDPILRSAAANLVAGGMVAFSVERLENNSAEYRLFPSGRYAHAATYIHTCLGRHGLRIVNVTHAEIRKQSGKPVEGLLVVARKA